MKKISFFLVSILILLFSSPGFCQQKQEDPRLDYLFLDKGEIYFRFEIISADDLTTLTRMISIDQVKGKEVHAYANRLEFSKFLELNIPYTILASPGTLLPESHLLPPYGQPDQVSTVWNYYPSYTQYLDLIAAFANTYPGICTIDTVGTSIQNRLILTLKISDNVGNTEAEPKVLLTSSIHGDELTGYVMMLHLIDHLLTNYGTDPAITDLINETEIFINPLANPDGTFNGGNTSVYGATRYNANYIDLNRNFPDPKVGPHPDGNSWQKETIAWMNYATKRNFTSSINFHGGSEVFNYPWDTWIKLSADDDWWQFVAREWADTVHNHAPSTYFDDLNNGITNGYAWYEINGGRQDYMNYFQGCREATVEISNVKTPATTTLLSFWEYNYRSFLQYIRQSQYGFNGIVTDTVTDQPVEAKVVIQGHDKDNSDVSSHLPTGFYARPVYAGNYDVTFSSPGYYTKTIENVTVVNRNTTRLDVQLRPLTYDRQDKTAHKTMVYPNPSNGRFKLVFPDELVHPYCAVQIVNNVGDIVYSSEYDCCKGSSSIDVILPPLTSGLYFLKFNTGFRIYVDKLIIKN